MYKLLLTLALFANLLSNSHGRIKDKIKVINALVDAVNARHQARGNIQSHCGPSDVIANTIESHTKTSCGNDKNATIGCGMNCGKRCSNYMKKDVECADICYAYRCECKKGYVFDDYTGVCVLPKDCSNQMAPAPDGSDKMSEGTSVNDEESPVEIGPSKYCDNCFRDCDDPDHAANESKTSNKTKNKDSNKSSQQSQCTSVDSQQIENDESAIVRASDADSKRLTKKNKNKDEYKYTNGNDNDCEKSATSSPTALESTTQDTDTCKTEALQSYIRADLAFTAKILHEIAQENYGSNLVIGGSSILYLLGQLQLFAHKSTADQIQKTLQLNNEQVACLLPAISNNITKPQYSIEYDLVTSIIADNNCSFTKKFKSRLQKVFHSDPLQYDFNNPLSARMINDMIAMHTNNHIKNFITSDVLSLFTNLILVDAQSFQGELQRRFDPKDTTEMEYHSANGRVTKKPIMFQSGKFLYTNSFLLGCRVLKMNYKGDEFGLVIFLPHLANGVPGLVRKLSSVDNVVKTFNNLRTVNVDIYLPRFKVSSASRLKFPVMKANIDKIFNATTAGLQRVASCAKPFVSGILQKRTLTVNENGGGNNDDDDLDFSKDSEPYNSNQRAHAFKANRPFVFYLLNKEILLFAGTYSY